MLVCSLTLLNRFSDHDHLVVAFFTSLKLGLISLLSSSILTQSCVKIMVHKFMSYFDVPLNGSFSIDRIFCDIHCFSFSIENIIGLLFRYQLKIL
ncbi:hypothetical protein HanPSC8_Chr09g0377231 [Helianthus annuus]|nr:hypothetical protein HanPSC8_Chr09g0377231 [Helianthus annuus]